MNKPLYIVKNLDMNHVTWAPSFCRAVERAGLLSVSDADALKVDCDRLFIGDRIALKSLGKKAINGYFLAAVDGSDEEKASILNTSFTTTVSFAENRRTHEMFGDAGAKVGVHGFPVDLSELDSYRQASSGRRLGTIGFLGRTDSDKGADLELSLVENLTKAGCEVVHISSGHISINEQLTKLGASVIEGATRHEYLSRTSSLGCVVNTSPRESLFVCGIEASRLGIPVFAPSVLDSGITEWNISERMYDPFNFDVSCDLIAAASHRKYVDSPDVSRYDAVKYISGIRETMESLRSMNE